LIQPVKAPIANPTFTGTVHGITQAMVGLGNVDTIADANKPISSATQGALDLKAPFAKQYLLEPMAGLGNVDIYQTQTSQYQAQLRAPSIPRLQKR